MNKLFPIVLALLFFGCDEDVGEKLYLREFVFPVDEALDQTVVYLSDMVYDNSNNSEELYTEYNAHLLGSDTILVQEIYTYNGSDYIFRHKGSSVYSHNGTIISQDSTLLNISISPRIIEGSYSVDEFYLVDYKWYGTDTLHMKKTYNLVYDDCFQGKQKMLNTLSQDLNGHRKAKINRNSAKGIGPVCGSVSYNSGDEKIAWQERFNKKLSSNEIEKYFLEKELNLSSQFNNKDTELSVSEFLTGYWCYGDCSGNGTWASLEFQEDGTFKFKSYTPLMNRGYRYSNGRWVEIGNGSINLLTDYDSNNQYLTGTEAILTIESNTEIYFKNTPYTKINE